MNKKLKVLVTGATGNQGSAVAKSLLARGHQVRALVLEFGEPGAQQLSELGAELVNGNFDNDDSIKAACDGVDSIYLMSTFYTDGPETEFKQATNVANIADKCGVGHLVYSSVANVAKEWNIPHFLSKWNVEKHIETLSIPSTVVGPTFFTDNLLWPQYIEGLKNGVLRLPVPATRKFAYVAVADIGEMIATVIERRESTFGGRYAFASDELDGNEVAKVLTSVIGRPIKYEEVPIEKFRKIARNEGVSRMFEWVGTEGFGIDISALHHDFSEINWLSFERWAMAQDWNSLLASSD